MKTAQLPLSPSSATLSQESQPERIALPPKTGQIAAHSPAATEVLNKLVHPRGSALSMSGADAPTYGTTTCLGKVDVELSCGTFTSYLFETTSFGSHVIALTKGDIQATDKPLIIRLHSECITSETLCGCDCDCVEQLNSALEQIANEGRGVLFYLRQEGRGAGYSQKARDRMAVAASKDELGTFDVYRHMGLPADARNYSALSEIRYLMDIQAPVEVLTNNPDKLHAIKELGFTVAGRREIAFASNPQNSHYLRTKGKSGHMLNDGERATAHYPWKVEPFAPHILPTAERFKHNASYPLPIRPKDSSVVIPAQDVLRLQQALKNKDSGIIQKVQHLSDTDSLVRVTFDPQKSHALRKTGASNPLDQFLLTVPYWFNDHVYHDSISQLDYVVLEYKRPTTQTIVPLVRIQSESLLSRFPLAKDRGGSVYAKAVEKIVEHGRGLVVLYPEDGRGNGISAIWKERQLIQSGRAKNTREACDILGIPVENREYGPIARLIRHHYGAGPIDLIFGSRDSRADKTGLLSSLSDVGISINGTHAINYSDE